MDFDTFSDITLELKIERVVIEKDNIDVLIHWQGTWKRDADDMGIRQRGYARLQWVGTTLDPLAQRAGRFALRNEVETAVVANLPHRRPNHDNDAAERAGNRFSRHRQRSRRASCRHGTCRVGRVIMLTKGHPLESNSIFAQGGVAVALERRG